MEDAPSKRNVIRREDGESAFVAPSSLAKHGLANGQKLTMGEWAKIGNALAIEWVAYVQSFDRQQ